MPWRRRAGPEASESRALMPAVRRTVVSRADFAEFLPDIQAVTEQQYSPFARVLIYLITGFLLLALIWAYVAQVEQVASATGVVRPLGKSKTINHPDGGRVAEQLVTEGAVVEAGQLLFTLDAEVLQEQATRQSNEWQTLTAEMARLEAEAAGREEIDFPADLAAGRPDLISSQNRLREARREAANARRAAAGRVIEQRESGAAALVEAKRRLENSLAIIREQEEAIRALVAKGHYPKLRHLSILRDISDQEGQIAEIGDKLSAAYSALEEARTQRLGLDHDTLSEVLDLLETRRRERDGVLSNLQQTKAQLRNLEIRAPVAGIVQNLAITGPGQAIRPNEPIMNVVPTSDSLVIEAEVSNEDIGYVSVGQQATVKVMTYDFLRFGALNGVVEQIAADAIEDRESGEFTFKVFVRTERNHLGEGATRYPVQPGMLVNVDLNIGERSILSYLTDRVLHTTESALRER